MTPKLVYVAGSYRAASRWEVEQNIRRAEATAARVLEAGAFPVCPHANTRGYLEDLATEDFFVAGTLELMCRCDAVVLVADDPNLAQSRGVAGELAEAIRRGLPVLTVRSLPAWLEKAQPASTVEESIP